MDKKEILAIIIVLLISVFLVFFSSLTGNTILEDNYSHINGSHWTHMPLTYTINKNCNNRIDNINQAIQILENSAADKISFKEAANNPDINLSCSFLDNCYENKTRRSWFWIITTEAICSHETGTAQITSRGNKIIRADINLVSTEKQENCSETEIHEILHIFGYQHSENNESIMFPVKDSSKCNEKIDSSIIKDLVNKYS